MFFWRNLKRSLKYLWPPYLMTRINRLEENHNSAWKKLCNIELEHRHIKEITNPKNTMIPCPKCKGEGSIPTSSPWLECKNADNKIVPFVGLKDCDLCDATGQIVDRRQGNDDRRSARRKIAQELRKEKNKK